jgi:molybdate transport system ATP-binding protein
VTIELSLHARHGDFSIGVDLSLPSRGVSSLFGPSGSGKTTLLRAIAGLDRHPGARVRVGGEVWQEGRHFVPAHRRPVGYIFQEASLFGHLSVRRNLEFGWKRVPRTERRVSLDSAVGLLDIGHLLDRDAATLSGGERQRVAIARALAVSPRLLLMDEPLAAVDVRRKQEILPYLESLHRGLDMPVIHVSHLPDEVARLADHLVVIEDGKILGSGPTGEVFTRLDLPPALQDDAAAVIDARVAGHDADYALTQLEFEGGRLSIPGHGLDRGQMVRIRIPARDVSLVLRRPQATSILNIIPATIDDMSPIGPAQLTVRLMAGDTPLLARITRKSAVELELQGGTAVFAQVKSVAVLT